MEWLVRGRTVGGLQLYGPDNLLDRETALRLYTRAGAELTGEADHKGMLAEGYLADLAVLSDDYLAVPAEDISRIESVLTITGGKIVYTAAEYEGLAAPLPPIEPHWSPVACYGAYQQSAPSGAAQARAVAEAACDSLEQRRWRMARGGPEILSFRDLDDTCRDGAAARDRQ
ncbi:MAG: amidohydrolase family protein [Streptosporangiaceae bacterium]|nr:amidohydrolase family protein [Streptosporangiaceae bacterium]